MHAALERSMFYQKGNLPPVIPELSLVGDRTEFVHCLIGRDMKTEKCPPSADFKSTRRIFTEFVLGTITPCIQAESS
jgi:hypothetical protein